MFFIFRNLYICKVKKIIVTSIFLSVVFFVYGQKKYYTMSECGNDPLKYIEKNYEDNANNYIGKTIGYWVDECEFYLSKYIPIRYSIWRDLPKELEGAVEKLRFDVCYDGYMYSIYIYISSNPPLMWKDTFDLEENWNEKSYNFFKKAKITKITISKRELGKFGTLKKYRRQ